MTAALDEKPRADLASFLAARGDRLVTAIMRVTGLPRADAEDAAQTALVNALERGVRLETADDWFRYLRAAGRNAAEDERRARARGTNVLANLAARAMASVTDVAEAVVLQEQLTALLADIDALPVEQREVLILRHVEGLKPRHIAARLGMKDRRVRYLLERAQETLTLAQRRRALAVAPLLTCWRAPRRAFARLASPTAVLSVTVFTLASPPALVLTPGEFATPTAHAFIGPTLPRGGSNDGTTGASEADELASLPSPAPHPVATPAPAVPNVDVEGEVCVNGSCVGTTETLPPPGRKDRAYVKVPGVAGQDDRYVFADPIGEDACAYYPTTPVTGCIESSPSPSPSPTP